MSNMTTESNSDLRKVIEVLKEYQGQLNSIIRNNTHSIELLEQVNKIIAIVENIDQDGYIDGLSSEQLQQLVTIGRYPDFENNDPIESELPQLNDIPDDITPSEKLSQIISNLQSAFNQLANQSDSDKDVSQIIVSHVNEILEHLSKGDIEAALSVPQRRAPTDLLDNRYLNEAITEASTGVNINDETENVTFGNYRNPFPSNGVPPTRQYTTFSTLKRIPIRFRYSHILNHLTTESNKKTSGILTDVKAESFNSDDNDDSYDSLANYTSKRDAIAKRKRLDVKAKRRAVPDTKLKRALAFSGLAASVGMGTLSELAKRSIADNSNSNKSLVLTEKNIETIVEKLCEFRGAALKIGQMISIQDEDLISPEFAKILARVRDSADFMPSHQLESQMSNCLGADWRDKFQEFEMVPFAAASLGQVHYGSLHDGTRVVVKVQYPGVAVSINSDIDNLSMLLNVTNLMPKGVYADEALKIAKREMAYETDYIREAESQEKMRQLLDRDEDFYVPKVYRELTSKQVLTQEFVEGSPIDEFIDAPLNIRNSIGLKMLKLCLRELFEFHFMQTDPNWSNFFYDPKSKKIMLLDFGATLPLTKEFSDDYLRVIRSCATRDRQTIIDASTKMGFLTGYESEVMLNAHCDAIAIVGEPFSTDEPYDFAEKAAYKRVAKLLEVFAKHRLTAPPEESYALNRKLSGAFLLCNKLRAVFPCKPLFDAVYFSEINVHVRT